MTLIRPSERATALILLIVFGGNFFFPLIYNYWYSFLPQHDHIILGPVYPGWELHSHGELIDPGERRRDYGESIRSFQTHQADSTEINIGPLSRVISLYRLPLENSTILAFGVQLLWLAGWSIQPEPSSLTWPAASTTLVPSVIFLPPPEKPPTAFL